MQEARKKEINILEYWQIFLRRKYFFIVPFALCVIIGIIFSIITPPVYESASVVQISQPQMLTPAMQKMVVGTMDQENEQLAANLGNLITSHSYLMRLIKALNLGNDPQMQEKARKVKNQYPNATLVEVAETLWLKVLRDKIKTNPIDQNFLEIKLQGNSPEFTFNVVRTLTKIFIDESLQNEAIGLKGAVDFSSEQLDLYKARLQESEARLQQFKESLVRSEFENSSVSATNLDKINSLLAAVELDLQEARDQLSFVENRINELKILYYPFESEELNRLKSRLLGTTIELSKVMSKYSWEDPEVLKMNILIDEIRGKIRNEIESNIKAQYFNDDPSNLDLIIQRVIIPIDIEFLERKKIEFNRLINTLKTNIASGPSRELTLSRLESEVQTNRAIYATLLQQSQGTEIERALQKTSAEFKFKIIEPAVKPVKPIKPKRTNMIIMSVAFGFFLGFGMISMLEMVDHSFRNVEEVEKYLGFPVLGIIPPIEMEGGYKNWSKQNIGR